MGILKSSALTAFREECQLAATGMDSSTVAWFQKSIQPQSNYIIKDELMQLRKCNSAKTALIGHPFMFSGKEKLDNNSAFF